VIEEYMQTTSNQVGDITVVQVDKARIDASNSRDFKAKVVPLVEAHPKVVIDMSAVEFVDSTGLGALVSCLKAASASGGDLRLCNISKPVRILFELTRMHRVFNIHNTLDEAVAAFGGS
jgi:anti-sigma B factor antagonist